MRTTCLPRPSRDSAIPADLPAPAGRISSPAPRMPRGQRPSGHTARSRGSIQPRGAAAAGRKKAIDENCSQQTCWIIAAVRTSSQRYQNRKAAQQQLPTNPGRRRRAAFQETNTTRSTNAAVASTFPSRAARTEPLCPALRMTRPSSAARLRASVWAETPLSAAFKTPSFSRWRMGGGTAPGSCGG